MQGMAAEVEAWIREGNEWIQRGASIRSKVRLAAAWDYDGSDADTDVADNECVEGVNQKDEKTKAVELHQGVDTTSPFSPSTSTSKAASAAADKPPASRPIAPLPRLASAYSLAPPA